MFRTERQQNMRMWRNWQTRTFEGRVIHFVWVQVPSSAPTKKSPLSTKTKVTFLNDGCLRQMMLALPMMTASPNDAWLRHILWQTSHHCGTKWSNIIMRSITSYLRSKCIIENVDFLRYNIRKQIRI